MAKRSRREQLDDMAQESADADLIANLTTDRDTQIRKRARTVKVRATMDKAEAAEVQRIRDVDGST